MVRERFGVSFKALNSIQHLESFPDLTEGSAASRAHYILADWPPLELNFLSVNARQNQIFHFPSQVCVLKDRYHEKMVCLPSSSPSLDLKSAHTHCVSGGSWTVQVFFRKAGGEVGSFGAVMMRTQDPQKEYSSMTCCSQMFCRGCSQDSVNTTQRGGRARASELWPLFVHTSAQISFIVPESRRHSLRVVLRRRA